MLLSRWSCSTRTVSKQVAGAPRLRAIVSLSQKGLNQVAFDQMQGGVAGWHWGARTAYATVIALSSGLASFILMASWATYFSLGERGEGFAIGWFVLGLPLIAVLSLLSGAFGYTAYRQRSTFAGTLLVFVTNTIVVTVSAVFAAAWAAGL